MELTPELAKTITDTHDTIIELRTLLIGKDGADGLCKQVEKHDGRIHRIELILAFVAGGGGLTGGIIGISRLLGG
jgi:hypothetical protein